MPKKRLSVARDAFVSAAVPELLSALLRRVRKPERHVRAGDPEAGVHDMRVAVKRFREALRLYQKAFRAEPFRRHRKAIEHVNDQLGEVRDRDVWLARLATYGIDDPPFTNRLRAERRAAHRDLIGTLDRLKQSDYWRALDRFVTRKKSYRSAARVAEAATIGVAELDARLAHLETQWRLMQFYPTPQTLHGARIANKKVRYALEPFLAWLPPACAEFYAELGRLHDALGDIHDDDELAARVVAAARAADSPALRDAWRGCEVDRRRHLADLRRSAARIEALGGWGSLRALIHGVRAAPPPREAAHGEREFKLSGSTTLPNQADLACFTISSSSSHNRSAPQTASGGCDGLDNRKLGTPQRPSSSYKTR